MRIISINHIEGTFQDGLSRIKMERLKKIVLLAGPNVAGKTRLLRRILQGNEQLHDDQLTVDLRDSRKTGIKYDCGVQTGGQAVEFTIDPPKLVNPQTLNDNERHQLANKVRNIGAVAVPDTTIPYIEKLQTQSFNATRIKTEVPSDKRAAYFGEYNSLEAVIESVLDTRLGRDIDGRATLFGSPIFNAKLSHGQRTLLMWCVAFHSQERVLGKRIILMDQPENHLHPEAIIAVVDHMAEMNPDGQLWIATHSVPLIASLYKNHRDDLTLHFMENGEENFASERPERVLTSLMGGEPNIEALREFVDLPEVLANIRFASQCLSAPDVVPGGNPLDPQIPIVREKLLPETAVAKVLDFGCGKGRLLESLLAQDGEKLQERLNYVAWDVSDVNRASCEEHLVAAYGESSRRWYNDQDKLLCDHHAGSFDAVVLCNVLHEISPVNPHFPDRN